MEPDHNGLIILVVLAVGLYLWSTSSLSGHKKLASTIASASVSAPTSRTGKSGGEGILIVHGAKHPQAIEHDGVALSTVHPAPHTSAVAVPSQFTSFSANSLTTPKITYTPNPNISPNAGDSVDLTYSLHLYAVTSARQLTLPAPAAGSNQQILLFNQSSTQSASVTLLGQFVAQRQNGGTVSAVVASGIVIAPGQSGEFLWTGGAWQNTANGLIYIT